jgi:hypothetical protein
VSGLCMGGDGLDALLPRNPSHFSAIQPNFGIIRHVSKSQNRPSDHTTEFNFCKFWSSAGRRGGGKRRSIRQRVVEGQEMRR